MWWRDIAALRREEWFVNHVSRVIGTGEKTAFWTDVWCGDQELGPGSIDFMNYRWLRGRWCQKCVI